MGYLSGSMPAGAIGPNQARGNAGPSKIRDQPPALSTDPKQGDRIRPRISRRHARVRSKTSTSAKKGPEVRQPIDGQIPAIAETLNSQQWTNAGAPSNPAERSCRMRGPPPCLLSLSANEPLGQWLLLHSMPRRFNGAFATGRQPSACSGNSVSTACRCVSVRARVEAVQRSHQSTRLSA
jgi:hypothetical protein